MNIVNNVEDYIVDMRNETYTSSTMMDKIVKATQDTYEISLSTYQKPKIRTEFLIDKKKKSESSDYDFQDEINRMRDMSYHMLSCELENTKYDLKKTLEDLEFAREEIQVYKRKLARLEYKSYF
jgi:hypothetical protein